MDEAGADWQDRSPAGPQSHLNSDSALQSPDDKGAAGAGSDADPYTMFFDIHFASATSMAAAGAAAGAAGGGGGVSTTVAGRLDAMAEQMEGN